MKKKFQIKGNLMIEVPKPFRRQQLSLKNQMKDKQIRKELQLLEIKRRQDIFLEKQCRKEKENLQKFKEEHEKQNEILREKEQAMKKQMFQLNIRKQQIQSRTNPAITEERRKTLQKYLKCIPYTIGCRLQKIMFWGSEEKYFRLKFLIEFGRDRFLKKSSIQRSIMDNLDKLVLCKKIKFENQWIMLTIKETKQIVSTLASPKLTKNKSRLCPTVSFSQVVYYIEVYAVSGKYYSFKKQCSYKDLSNWVDFLKNKDQPKLHKPRISVVDTIARQNALKQFAMRIKYQVEGQSSSSKEVSSGSTIKKPSVNTMYNQSLPTYQNGESFNSTYRPALTELWEDKNQEEFSQISPNVSQSHQSSRLISEMTESNSETEEQEKGSDSKPSHSRKTLRSKSSFCPKQEQKSVKNVPKLFNKSFLGGREELLFPKEYPIQNLIIFREKKQLYFLPQYLQIQEKKQILEKAIGRFKLKIKIRKELRKCLFYKIVQFNQFYQSKLFLPNTISIPLLFMIKKSKSKEQNELLISCCSITQHPDINKAIDFVTSFHKEKTQKTENKDERSKRVSINKNSPKSNIYRKSRDYKRKSTNKNKDSPDKYQKSSFNHDKKKSELFEPFSQMLVEKFNEFLKNNFVSFEKQRFVSKLQFTKRVKTIISIQATFKRKMQQVKYKHITSKAVLSYKYLKNEKIFISCLSLEDRENNQVFIESLNFGAYEDRGHFYFPKKYQNTVFSVIESFNQEGTLLELKPKLNETIKNAIEKENQLRQKRQRERPEKNRRAIKRFMYMMFLRMKARKNIFYLKKIVVKQRFFILIIRRDNRFRNILECSLYDFPGIRAMNMSFSKQASSQFGFHKQFSQSNKQFNSKSYIYQHIYLQQKYFKGIDKKAISDEFLIDYKVFLLKPQKNSSVYYIQRLNFMDINGQEISKQFISLEKEQSVPKQSNFAYSSKSIKCLLNGSILPSKKQNLKLDSQIYDSGVKKKKVKKNSIDSNDGFLGLIKQSVAKDYVSSYSKASLAESLNFKKNGYKIIGNSHQAIIYFSLYKAMDIFFYLDLYIIKKTLTEKNYSENLIKVSSQRLYKKQLQDKGNDLIIKKIAEWLCQNEDKYLTYREKDKIEEPPSKNDFEEGMNIFKNCVELFQTTAGKQRFSFDKKNMPFLGENQKNSRNNTHTF